MEFGQRRILVRLLNRPWRRLARRFEGTPGVLGVRKSLTAAAKDDFWKVRKAA